MSRKATQEDTERLMQICRIIAPELVEITRRIMAAAQLGNCEIPNHAEVREVETALFNAGLRCFESGVFD